MTIIITGSNGFSACYLSQFVKENRSASSIIGIDISRESKNHCVDVYFSLADFAAAEIETNEDYTTYFMTRQPSLAIVALA